jgi:hypothetical protein
MLARHCAGAGMSAQAVQHWLKAIKRGEARAQHSEVFAQMDAGMGVLTSLRTLLHIDQSGGGEFGSAVASKDGSRRHCLGNAGEDVEFALEYG